VYKLGSDNIPVDTEKYLNLEKERPEQGIPKTHPSV